MELAYFAGLSHTQIAERIQASVGTVKGHLHFGPDGLRTAPGTAPAATTADLSGRAHALRLG